MADPENVQIADIIKKKKSLWRYKLAVIHRVN